MLFVVDFTMLCVMYDVMWAPFLVRNANMSGRLFFSLCVA